MKHIFILILAALALVTAPAFGQKKFVENRNGLAVIVIRDTFPTGETTETVIWKANPKQVLESDLKESIRVIEWTESKIQTLQAELKRLYQERNETEKAIQDLDKGLFIEDGTVKSVPVQPSAPVPKPKKAKKKKQ